MPLVMHEPPRFDVEKEAKELVQYLNEHGYVVVKGVADAQQVSAAKDAFWEYMETCTASLQQKGKVATPVKRGDVRTWSGKQWLPNAQNGILTQYGFNHSSFLWNTRLLPKVKAAFAAIWRSNDLLVSFDAGNAFRPWKLNPGKV